MKKRNGREATDGGWLFNAGPDFIEGSDSFGAMAEEGSDRGISNAKDDDYEML